MLPHRRMLQRRLAVSVLLLSNYIFYGESMKPGSFHAIQTARYPRTSCHRDVNIPSKSVCFISCLNRLHVHYMFSYNPKLQSCLCCQDLSGSEITDKDWSTCEPRPCKDNYVTYSYGDLKICLKYVPDLVRYSQARAHCEAEGGDLIRIDSTLKYNIFKELLAPFASPAEIQVWIQAVKIEHIWRFHDGSLVPDIFHIGMSNNSEEIHLRAISTDNFKSHDAPDGNRYSYLCEYYPQFKRTVHEKESKTNTSGIQKI